MLNEWWDVLVDGGVGGLVSLGVKSRALRKGQADGGDRWLHRAAPDHNEHDI